MFGRENKNLASLRRSVEKYCRDWASGFALYNPSCFGIEQLQYNIKIPPFVHFLHCNKSRFHSLFHYETAMAFHFAKRILPKIKSTAKCHIALKFSYAHSTGCCIQSITPGRIFECLNISRFLFCKNHVGKRNQVNGCGE